MKKTDPNFKVPITKILDILPHPNPDVHSLVIAKVYDFDVIISNKSGYQIGDRVIYFPVNSVLAGNIENFIFPPNSLIKLEKSRVKAVRIQKFVSQGLIAKWDDIRNLLNLPEFRDETDLQEELKIVKYYPPAPMPASTPSQKKQRNKPLENVYFKEYNGCTNIRWEPFAFSEDDNVYITEKIHGSNWRVGYLPYEPPTLWQKLKHKFLYFFTGKDRFEFCYGSNTVQRQNKQDSPTWYKKDIYLQMVEKYDLKNKLKDWPGIVLYGEIYGPTVQKSYHYGLKNDDIDVVIFDIMEQSKDGQRWFDLDSARNFSELLGLKFVPVLYEGKWNKDKAISLATGNSVFCKSQKTIEGVVVKNYNLISLNRKKIKIINPDYLMKESADETTDFQ